MSYGDDKGRAGRAGLIAATLATAGFLSLTTPVQAGWSGIHGGSAADRGHGFGGGGHSFAPGGGWHGAGGWHGGWSGGWHGYGGWRVGGVGWGIRSVYGGWGFRGGYGWRGGWYPGVRYGWAGYGIRLGYPGYVGPYPYAYPAPVYAPPVYAQRQSYIIPAPVITHHTHRVHRVVHSTPGCPRPTAVLNVPSLRPNRSSV